MTTPAVTPGKGVTLAVTVGTATVTIGQIASLTAPGVTQQVIDTTDLDQTWDTVIGSINRSTEMSGVLNWDASHTSHDDVWTCATSSTVRPYLVTFPNSGNSTQGFDGVMTKFEPTEATPEGIVKVNFSVKPSGPISLTV